MLPNLGSGAGIETGSVSPIVAFPFQDVAGIPVVPYGDLVEELDGGQLANGTRRA
ncbi:uncharacterized protein V6R79_006214 [Siganus canaliculatus]